MSDGSVVGTTALLVQVVTDAAEAASVTLPDPLREIAPAAKLRWGAQREVIGLEPNTCTATAG